MFTNYKISRTRQNLYQLLTKRLPYMFVFINFYTCSFAHSDAILETDTFFLKIDNTGNVTQLVDKSTGKNYIDNSKETPFARLKGNNKSYVIKAIKYDLDTLTADFGEEGGQVEFKISLAPSRIVFEVRKVSWDDAEELHYAEMPLNLKGTFEDPFAVTPLALDLKTNCNQIPGLCSKITGFIVYKRFGFEGAKGAIIACSTNRIRDAMKDAIRSSPELPQSDLGGPWALDAKINQGSYLISTSEYVTEKTVSQWIEVAKRVGATQIDFHGGYPFRWGDFELNAELYPNKKDSLKAVIDAIHQAGLYAGLHTYSFFIDKNTPWVTPVPDPRLDSDAIFTLSNDITSEDTDIYVDENTENMSNVTGFFIRNSVTLRIENELITYQEVQKNLPYAFRKCTRGAYGTKPSEHKKGAKVYHLKECFGLFVPDPNTSLFTEVIQKTADLYNYCGFDMIYLDALDGSDILGGWENAWHYSAKFVYELVRRLNKPPVMEMSTFSHHLWCVRSRMGAWDCPMRGKKEFVDYHLVSNRIWKYSFLPTNLGWWGIFDWDAIQPERSMPDELEYVCVKALATDSSLSYVVGFTPKSLHSEKFSKFANIAKKYEELRAKEIVPNSLKSTLAEPGAEFTLEIDENGKYKFRPVIYSQHTISTAELPTQFIVSNPYAPQPLQLRIEALIGIDSPNTQNSKILTDFSSSSEFSAPETQNGVSATLEYPIQNQNEDKLKAVIRAQNTNTADERAWAIFKKNFQNYLDFTNKGLGVWIKGDGHGEVLNIQIASPKHLIGGFADHYVKVDFIGWKYFELIEPESYNLSLYEWPHTRLRKDLLSGGHEIMSFVYPMYHYWVNFKNIATLMIGVNNIPQGKTVEIGLGTISAIPLRTIKIKNPSIQIGDSKIYFPVEIESGNYIEFLSKDNCKLYNSKHELVGNITPSGDIPTVTSGENIITFNCDNPNNTKCRTRITIIMKGTPIHLSTNK